ncbi:MAG: DegT/DnrJ/EryC1/StrS family aminotransferase [bacterium]|nr:DegT/DnrJ/EryC1/StrS family aminotransferase [bacterium]
MIPMFSTYISPSAYTSIKKVLDSTRLSEGVYVRMFEDTLEKNLGLLNPTAVNSGTSALHLALVVAGVKSGDEVICPSQTFIATAMAILHQGAVPVFCDIHYENGNSDVSSIESLITPKTKAIMVVHWAGYPCDLDEIHLIAKKYGLKVIEDAAHALGAVYKGSRIGGISDFTCFSFQAIKHLTTGDGGALCCINPGDSEKARTQRWFGIDREHSFPGFLGEREQDISEIGYKYHMNDYAAALGVANMENFNERLSARKRIAEHYSHEFSGIHGLHLFSYSSDRESAFWLFGMHVEDRSSFIRAMNERGVSVSVVHQGIHRHSIFGALERDLPNQKQFDQTQIHIPLHDGLSDEDVETIIHAVKKGW